MISSSEGLMPQECMSIHKLEGTHGVYVQELGKALQVLNVSYCDQYFVLPARDIKGSAREKLLDTSNTNTTEAHRTFAALKSISEETCALLEMKQNTVDSFSFRLLQSPHLKNVLDDDIESFIALSYTWHSPTPKTPLVYCVSSPGRKRPFDACNVGRSFGSASETRMFLD